MKKVLVFILVLFSITLTSCSKSTEYDYSIDIQNLQEQIADLQVFYAEAPAYVLDDDGNYIDFDTVSELLFTKYFGNEIDLRNSKVSEEVFFHVQLYSVQYDSNEYIARMILLINELKYYEFYMYSSALLYCYTIVDDTVITWIKIPMHILQAEFISITPEVICNQQYETLIYGMTFDEEIVQQYYDSFVSNGTFDGYVLNYD